MMESYKDIHESFLSHLHGTSMSELGIVMMIVPLCLLFHRVMRSFLFETAKDFSIGIFIVDFACVVLPQLFVYTWTDTFPQIALYFLLVSALAAAIKKGIAVVDDVNQLHALNVHRKMFVTEFRSCLLLSTFICILAVDFQVFPRRFAKTESFGFSLMDLGVGAFVFSSGIVAKKSTSVKYGDKLVATLKSASPLALLGICRLMVVKASNYQEHVSEYGVHWNFFFTLSSVAILLALLNISPEQGVLWASVLMGGYQYVLIHWNLTDYIEHAPRDSLLSQNREGLCSIVGYMCVYILGAVVGRKIMERRSYHQWGAFALQLSFLAAILWALTWLAHNYVQEASRKMANLAYVLCVLAIDLQVLAAILVVSLITPPIANYVLLAVNQNGLSLFLLANILTGIVNLSIQTIYSSDLTALCILAGYMFAICSVGVILYKHNVVLKYW